MRYQSLFRPSSSLLLVIVSLIVHASAGMVIATSDASKTQDDVLAIQVALVLCGYQPGVIDGRMGPETRTAIEAFIIARPHPVDASTELARRAATVKALSRSSFSGYDNQDLLTFKSLIAAPPSSPLQDARSHDPRTAYREGMPQASQPSLSSYPPHVAENGDIGGVDNDDDGRRETVYVRGYFRKDGTYVRSHYRARPRR